MLRPRPTASDNALRDRRRRPARAGRPPGVPGRRASGVRQLRRRRRPSSRRRPASCARSTWRVNEYQQAARTSSAAWGTRDGPASGPGFPARVNDLQFLTGPCGRRTSTGWRARSSSAGTRVAGPVGVQRARAAGVAGVAEARPRDWMVANPLRRLVRRHRDAQGRRRADALRPRARVPHRRAGLLAAAPGRASTTTTANSGDLRRDATAPGTPTDARLDGKTLRFTSPGDDLLCGRPAAYEISVDGGAVPPRDRAAR